MIADGFTSSDESNHIAARSLEIKKVLQGNKFLIPEYQREFAWGVTEVEELINDLNDISDSDKYFIGHMVFEGRENGDTFQIIDGQQRITTIVIMICALRDIFYERGENDLADPLNDKYIIHKDDRNKPFPGLSSEMSYPILQKYVQKKPIEKEECKPTRSGEKNIIEIYDFVVNEFKKYSTEELETFRDKLLNIEVIFVSAQGMLNAQRIFMTINARGKDLSFVDLIKSQIFVLYPNQDSLLQEPNDSWSFILSNVGTDIEEFFYIVWHSRFKLIQREHIFKDFMKLAQKQGFDIKDFVNKLKEDSVMFAKMQAKDFSNWSTESINEYSAFYSINAIINVFGINKAITPYLLALLRAYFIDKKISLLMFKKILGCLEKFHFINNSVCANYLGGFDKFYSKKARDLLESTNKQDAHKQIKKTIDDLNERIPTLEEFKETFSQKVYYNPQKARTKRDYEKDKRARDLSNYVLKKLEFLEQNSNISFHKISLEHLYPASYDNWPKLQNFDNIKYIGNLVLLDSDLNSKLGNKDFDYKKEKILRESKIITTKLAIKDKEKWCDEEINERTNRIVEEYYNLKF
ncbi:DUF262 domain-containing protein [Neisseria animaloris]|uniref:Uncharacterized conserved protein n=1 Tax=Neisseria animaloris TaxID=326522 RepID=A0A3S4YA31_9NEIS|nr:DUF262 domain-containing protein [Neisseria animaloris]VEJ20986.1 Uncharacterized conserved protein [Neisseria animaloris]